MITVCDFGRNLDFSKLTVQQPVPVEYQIT